MWEMNFELLAHLTYGPSTVDAIQFFFQASGMNQQDELRQTSLLLLREHQKEIVNDHLSAKEGKSLGQEKREGREQWVGQIRSESIVYCENVMKLGTLYDLYVQVKQNNINKKCSRHLDPCFRDCHSSRQKSRKDYAWELQSRFHDPK